MTYVLYRKEPRKLDAQSAGSRVMFEQETDFLVRDLKAIEDPCGTHIVLRKFPFGA